MTSAHWAASAIVLTVRPAARAFLNRLARRRKTDDDVDTAVLQVERMRVSLGPVSHDRHFSTADQLDVRVLS